MLKRVAKIIVFFSVAVVGGIFADQIFWPYFVERPLFYKYRLEQAPVYLTEVKQITISEENFLKEAAEKVGKAVVGIQTKTKAGKTIEGSGLVVSSDGLVVTLAELVPVEAATLVFMEGKSPSFRVLKRDIKENLALLKLDENNLVTVGFADLAKLRYGEKVFLVAMVFEKEAVKKPTTGPKRMLNEGIVKSFDSQLLKTNILEKNNIQASGLFNISGEFLGLNLNDSGNGVTAIPADRIKSFCGF